MPSSCSSVGRQSYWEMPQSLDHSKLEGNASTLQIIGHILDASELNLSSDGPDERKIFTCTRTSLALLP
jgi:hypothetical protein